MQSEQKMMKSSKLPIQAVPVERTVTGVPMSNQNGVDASQHPHLDHLLQALPAHFGTVLQ
ncbi:MAG: hypothetical protein F6J86_31290 [Symploca sp. SIO1B1]|nr:hypothetical protein [Symploca sp. SIO1B1]